VGSGYCIFIANSGSPAANINQEVDLKTASFAAQTK
jgi:hypothetical protein